VRNVVVGDARTLFLPDLSAHRTGRDRLCGLRLVHTHLDGSPLNDDDLTDLALLRLDRIAAVGVQEDGMPGLVYQAHLLPANDADIPWELLPPCTVHDLHDDFLEQIHSLEEEFARKRSPRSANDTRDRALLVHVSGEPRGMAEESMAELSELARSAGIKPVADIIQRRAIDPRFVMGKGKLQETVIKAMQLGAETLVFDLNLAPSQVEGLAAYTDLKILDRTQVILDIFAQRAETREGRLQVELAQLRYLLPKLGARQSASAFSRLTGGIGGRGPGETKLEIDRRRAKDRIALLEREIVKLGDRRKLRRSRRSRSDIPVVSVVGYTNAGKSTLLNQLTQSQVVARDALFATLNPVSRRLRFPKEREIIITDTVGFIRKLPKELMEAFRTTLEELHEADLLLHVADASSHDLRERFDAVQDLLRELDLAGKPVLVVLNKTDKADPGDLPGLMRQYNAIPVCALDTGTFTPLMEALEERLWPEEQGAQTAHALGA
jgi:GTPase